MVASAIRLDEGVREEIARIASELGRTFNTEKGFPFPVKLETAQKTAFDMSSDVFETACKDAVAKSENPVAPDYIARCDKESGMIMKVHADGRVEYVLN